MSTTSSIPIAATLVLAAQFVSAAPLSTAITYQGRLMESGAPANGRYDLQCAIFDAASVGTQEAITTNLNVTVSNGLFTSLVDFGGGPSPAHATWLEIGVRTNGSAGAFTTLTPRQPVTPVPLAFYAMGASNVADGAISPEQLNTVNSPAAGQVLAYNSSGTLVWTNAASAVNAWALTGNAGTTAGTHFLGTTDNQPVEIRANGTRALRIEPKAGNVPNLVLGSSINSLAGNILGATISGGYGNAIRTNSDYTVIGGGNGNIIQTNADSSVISGGSGNFIDNNSPYSVMGGGYYNTIQTNSSSATISGGMNNRILFTGYNATVGGGNGNTISNNSSGATIAGGDRNLIEPFAYNSSIGGGIDNAITTIGHYATIAGGKSNRIEGIYATVGGGGGNVAEANAGTVAGGSYNYIGYSGILGATISGGSTNSITNNAAYASIGGGLLNQIGNAASNSVISGGQNNRIETYSWHSLIGGGQSNLIYIRSPFSVIAGGDRNTIETNSSHAAIGGGRFNIISNSPESTISGGYQNKILNRSGCATVGGGMYNQVLTNGGLSVIGGGYDNYIIANGTYGVIPGGKWNYAGSYAFAAGYRASATNTGSFVWSDSTGTGTGSTTSNSVTFRASGGYRFFSTTTNVGAQLAAGSGSWTTMSDRNAKADFESVDALEILEKVTALPLSTWRYKTQDESVRHVGPMAQDFKAAFGVGETDTGISTVDADGVALAAIQGLNQKLEAEAELRNAEIQELRQTIEELKRLIASGILSPAR